MSKALRALLACLAIVLAAWALAVWWTGGLAFTVAGVRVSARGAGRPLAAAAACAMAWLWLTGPARARQSLASLAARARPAWIAAALAAGCAAVAVAHNGWTAGGADQYAYASQMDLWLAGARTIPVPLAAHAPWPDALTTFTPYGHRPALGGAGIVPVTAPGFSWLMAAFKAVGGHCAAFLVPPACAALLVWCAFAIGRRVGGDAVGLGAAWLMATSPVVLAMSKATMSDVPAAAFWAAAILGVLRPGVGGALAGGLAASVAILIRPNLAPVAAALAVWRLWCDLRREPRSPVAALAFSAAVVPGALATAWVNTVLYGSPLTSGYGALDALFSPSNAATNLWRYGAWVAQTQTQVAWLGLAALAVAPARIWPAADARAGARLLALVALVVLSAYVFYAPFDAWWYLRFLLPAWPAVCVGTAALVAAASSYAAVTRRVVLVGALAALGLFGVRAAATLGVYPPGEGERRYASIAGHVARITEPDAVILAGQHSGALRYYAGRTTIRFDLLNEEWLDEALAWLQGVGRRPYLLLEDWELGAFSRRFGARSDVSGMQSAPLLAYKSAGVPGVAYLFDPFRRDGPTEQPFTTLDPRPRCVAPAPALPR